MTQQTISLTSDDIKAGIVGNCRHCPVAIAMNRTLDDPQGRLRLHPTLHWVWEGVIGYESVIAPLPKEAISFMRNFDVLKIGNPFVFVVQIIKE